MTLIRCEAGGCDVEIGHDEADCETDRGVCRELVRAGWAPVWIRCFEHGGRKLFARGGWLCPEHASVNPEASRSV